ncbi:MAG TPA: glycoside hydrolase family 65 protein [Candidatus Phocaeicola caecigallinarum]|nr:glycoside hydrolase family 65 protein [Candidatus Phocaeicola caecigallinarum]
MNLRWLGIALSCIFSWNIMKASVENDALWQVRATDLHAPYASAPMASGCIGILPDKEPFRIGQVVLNHVFDAAAPGVVSRVMKGINPFGIQMKIDGMIIDTTCIKAWEQTVDMRRAVHRTTFEAGRKVQIVSELRALRNLPYAGLVSVQVKALTDVVLEIRNGMNVPDDYAADTVRYRELDADGTRLYLLEAEAVSARKYRQVAAASTFMFDGAEQWKPSFDKATGELFFMLSLKKGETLSFSLVGSICSSRDFTDPYNEAERQVVYAVHEGKTQLIQAHERLWNTLWQSDIRIEGDDDAQRLVRFALFNLYASCRAGSRLSIPPMGLSSQGYNGHIFWDTELWMYPPMLLLQPDMARSMLDYRVDRKKPARRKAMAYGYKGAMYPWESDDTGEEATPTFALTGAFEHHITADVGIACWNYYCVTRDSVWLKREGFPLLKEIAEFWVSRSVCNADGSYSIVGVTGADEYANGVTDNAFTNASASLVLDYASRAGWVCGEQVPSVWSKVSRGLRILQFEDGVTREHATYQGETIKQADVNLLAYPLGKITDVRQQQKDLAYYAERIDQRDGPMMSYAVFCVQYARMGNAAKAYEMFCRCYQPNWRPPFGVLSETPSSNNPYFMTGAGGLLQAVLNGFCGLQVTEKGIIQLPSVLPLHWKKVTVTGVGVEKKVYVREQ